MGIKKIQVLPLNRVEGDLELHLEIEDQVVSEARSIGTMYRGFENLLRGRAPLDGLVITPRVCGICSTSHLKAATKALDMIFKVHVPDDAIRVRNITLMAEQLQNDLRHTFLLFMPDFARSAYKGRSFFEEAVARYLPLKGETAVRTIRETKKIVEIIAILGGQWPHSSFMVPGGVVSVPGQNDINQCRSLLSNFRRWYEKRVLGCTLARWKEIKSSRDLEAWYDEDRAHQEGDLGFFMQISNEIGLYNLGKGHNNFVSFGSFEMPGDTVMARATDEDHLFPSGFSLDGVRYPFQQEKVSEDVAFSYFRDVNGPGHPFEGQTVIEEPGRKKDGYSWSKAPRYDGYPAETGPLAESFMAANPLFSDLLKKSGSNAFLRQLARLVRPAYVMPALDCWLKEIVPGNENFYRKNEQQENGRGFGLIQAHRGALGHWVELEDGKISNYQIITPTAWNGSPRDGRGVRGPWEEAIVGTQIRDPDDPVEIGHIVRSFDPCLVCCVHVLDGRGNKKTVKIL